MRGLSARQQAGVRTTLQTLILPVACAVVLGAVILLGGSPWTRNLQAEPLSPIALIVDGLSFGVGAGAVAMILAWLWDLPYQIGHMAIQKSEGPENTFLVFASNKLQKTLTVFSKFGFEQKSFLILTASMSPAGITFWRGAAAPTPVSTISWADIRDFRAGVAASEVQLALELPDGSGLTLSESVREPKTLSFWPTVKSRRDDLVSTAMRMRSRGTSRN